MQCLDQSFLSINRYAHKLRSTTFTNSLRSFVHLIPLNAHSIRNIRFTKFVRSLHSLSLIVPLIFLITFTSLISFTKLTSFAFFTSFAHKLRSTTFTNSLRSFVHVVPLSLFAPCSHPPISSTSISSMLWVCMRRPASMEPINERNRVKIERMRL